ncbi:MAG TPA: 50S ribosomal protein L1 [Chloroflexota bacterium]|nr:50S ribosomal protein L1 [Chloroflexota bacterium]
MKKRGKRYAELAKLIDEDKNYAPAEAVELVRKTSNVKFDSTIEVHMRMGLDVRHADQQVRGMADLPAGTGKNVRVLVFAEGDKAREAEQAGADFVGSDDLIKRVEDGWTDFDVALATRDMMGKVGRLGKVLGRRGLMPNPKSGTITDDLTRSVKEVKAGRIEFRTGKAPLIQVPIGKASFDEKGLLENLGSLVDAVVKAKPAGSKGPYIKNITLTSTMGPGVRLDVPQTMAKASES